MDRSDYERVTEILSRAGISDYSMVPQDVMERASLFGTHTHLACELYDRGTLDISTVHAGIIPYLNSYKYFLDNFAVVIEDIEREVVSERWKFRGHLDRVGIVNGVRTLIDLKTSTIVLPAVSLQTGGYTYAYHEEEKRKKIRKRLCVQLTEGIPNLFWYDNPHDEAVFIACLQVARWRAHNKLTKEQLEWITLMET